MRAALMPNIPARGVLVVAASAALLAGCADWNPFSSPEKSPLTVDGARGSEDGNYGMVPSGETVVLNGETCAVWLWDRPLSATRVLRVRSASCPAPDRPDGMVATELDRKVIPMAQSYVAQDLAATTEGSGSSTPPKP
jgi:hypothetical protein